MEKQRIDEMFAFVASDDEGEGVLSVAIGREHMPLVGADMARMDSLRELAREVAQRTKTEVRLLKFTHREELEVIK